MDVTARFGFMMVQRGKFIVRQHKLNRHDLKIQKVSVNDQTNGLLLTSPERVLTLQGLVGDENFLGSIKLALLQFASGAKNFGIELLSL
jgi:hypothetical protein